MFGNYDLVPSCCFLECHGAAALYLAFGRFDGVAVAIACLNDSEQTCRTDSMGIHLHCCGGRILGGQDGSAARTPHMTDCRTFNDVINGDWRVNRRPHGLHVLENSGVTN